MYIATNESVGLSSPKINIINVVNVILLMKIGVLKEIKILEGRVALTPHGVHEILESKLGSHEVYVQTKAGMNAGFSDEEYKEVGAVILQSAKEVWDQSTLIVHVKEPLQPEFQYIQSYHILFTYLHLAAESVLTKKLMELGCIAFAYETLESENHSLPLLAPMSKVAGKMAFVYGLYCSQKKTGGRGVYVGQIDGKSSAKCLIIGGGVVGVNSAESFIGIGVDVTIIEKNSERRQKLQEQFPTATILPDTDLKKELPKADIVIGAVLIHGAKAPKLISKEDIRKMKKGAVIVDISIDQGGITEVSKPTSIENPTYEFEGILLCCIPNIPGTVPKTSTELLTEATLPYIIQLANEGTSVIKSSRAFQTALNIYNGKCTNQPVAKAVRVEFTDPLSLDF
ncbi:MAG: alanine dehydrogenase [Promethearchaeota archaeon]